MRLLVTAALALALGCGAAARAQPAACAEIPRAAKVAEVGAFTNVRYTEEHAYGYTVLLWRAGDCWFGLFESSQGLAGDTPVGTMQDVKYDAKKRTLSFSAKLTTGVVSVTGSSPLEPARDLFTFTGELKASRLTGVVVHALQNIPSSPPEREDVTMAPSREVSELMHGSATYGEWLDKWQSVLQVRGPKWPSP